ncbi:molybdopterin-containing oxidoreductase family protein [Pseudomonas sp. H11T01]|uniref:molybdopterin-containing oxidoreductase family protein n=1 Tax=Pseudomonas sp. H11T01 TaxID=3402749 RepID=UPI003AC4D11C
MVTQKSFCRLCHSHCATEVDVVDGKLVAVRGNHEDPISGGYTCVKGRQGVAHAYHPDRLTSSMKRGKDGSYTPISSQVALDEIHESLARILDKYGPRSIATYNGAHGFSICGAWDSAHAFHAAIGSPSYYSSATVDQPAKFGIAPSRTGIWEAGLQEFAGSDVGMYFGNNPLVSHYTGEYGGIPPFSPARRLNDSRANGFKLIVVDPRRTELARRADIFLQIRPGEDPTLLCGLLRIIFKEGLQDHEFCARYVSGLDELQSLVEDFTLDYVERRTLVPRDLILEAARVFASGPRGIALAGTGPNMSPRAPLAEHLITCLNAVCGRYKREGEVVHNVSVLYGASPRRAQVIPAWDASRGNPPSRVRGIKPFAIHIAAPNVEFPSSILADEILTPGEGQIRALISVAGNPLLALPDQAKMRRALSDLDLFVQIDINMSASARLADYVIGAKVGYERAEVDGSNSGVMPAPYASYTPAIIEPRGDLIEEWEFFWEILHRMGLPLTLPGRGALPMDRKPTKDEVLDALYPNTRVPLDVLRASPGGKIFEEFYEKVLPADPDNDARLNLAPSPIPEEIRQVRSEANPGVGGGYGEDAAAYSHRLISRRLANAYNSALRELPGLQKGRAPNHALLNPADMELLGLQSGDLIEIESALSSMPAVVHGTDDVAPGVISLAHGWGDTPEADDRVREQGSSVNRIIDAERSFDPWTGMGMQSAVPVNVRKHSGSTATSEH